MDNLGGSAHDPHIDVSYAVLCLCTQRWFTNKPCLREVVRGILRKKHIIALLEPDASIYGGLTEVECRRVLQGATIQGGRPYVDRLEDLRPEVEQWSTTWAEPVQLPTAKEVEDALFQSAPIVWSPLADFQAVALRMIAERLLPHVTHAYGTPYKQMAYIKGEIGQRVTEFKLKALDSSKASSRPQSNRQGWNSKAACFHLYCSKFNPGAIAVAQEIALMLRGTQTPLRCTDKLEELDACQHMLVHLSSETWTRGEDSDALAKEVHDAKQKGVHWLKAHEVAGVRADDEARHGCPFDEVIQSTPPQLREAGIYSEISMNLAGGEQRHAGLIGLVRELAKDTRQRAPRRRAASVVGFKRPHVSPSSFISMWRRRPLVNRLAAGEDRQRVLELHHPSVQPPGRDRSGGLDSARSRA